MRSNVTDSRLPVIVNKYFIDLVTLFITVCLFKIHFLPLTIRFTALSPTPDVSVAPFANLVHCWKEVGRAMAQAVSCRLLIVAARIRSQVRLCEIFVGQNGRFFPSSSVSPANSHSNNCSMFINHPIDAV
jgi:hypothetical protein